MNKPIERFNYHIRVKDKLLEICLRIYNYLHFKVLNITYTIDIFTFCCNIAGDRIWQCPGFSHQFPGYTNEHQIYPSCSNTSSLHCKDGRTEGPRCFGLRGEIDETIAESFKVASV